RDRIGSASCESSGCEFAADAGSAEKSSRRQPESAGSAFTLRERTVSDWQDGGIRRVVCEGCRPATERHGCAKALRRSSLENRQEGRGEDPASNRADAGSKTCSEPARVVYHRARQSRCCESG